MSVERSPGYESGPSAPQFIFKVCLYGVTGCGEAPAPLSWNLRDGGAAGAVQGAARGLSRLRGARPGREDRRPP